MGFKELDEALFTRPKKLPFGGKQYAFPGSVSARTGLLMHKLSLAAEQVMAIQEAKKEGREPPKPQQIDLDEEILSDEEQQDLRAEVLGDAQLELIRDNVPHNVVEHMVETLICWHQYGEEIAEKVWEDVPGAPKAPQDRKRKATGNGTRKGSRAGTTNPTPAAAESAGEPSSDTGS